ncbi:hypothetical protein FGADI_12490 [Fusarium gaditjirri]|uniref:Uncharacterized protein n=1 Tax=Fusarium gaditjirri TaxID=282569 RepID=A0A8H4SS56_9HYPO|nr:hypothetical protein FGADI_12490 [Fusarium gaditjirri]
MSSQRDTFDPANLPRPGNMVERRRYIDQYIQCLYGNLVSKIEKERKSAYLLVCKYYHEDRHYIEVPSVYFEYVVDKTLWGNIFRILPKSARPDWPWSPGPDVNDMSSGMSTVYRQWRIDNRLPIAPQQEPDTPSGLTSQINDPGVADQVLREAWSRCFDIDFTGFIRGPFALNLPAWMDFENLVLGEDGRDIDAVNKEFVEPGLKISLETFGAAQLGLVVPLGLAISFKDEASLALPQVQRNLHTLWCDVVAWFCEVVAGCTVSLASYLRVMQVTSYSVERTPSHDKAESLWQDALREPQNFADRAREARMTLLEWSPMIQQIVDKPFGEAEQELGTLVWGHNSDLFEHKRRLAIVRQVWLYGSREPKVIRRAFNWLTYFSATL